jgi:hypothetical protein
MIGASEWGGAKLHAAYPNIDPDFYSELDDIQESLDATVLTLLVIPLLYRIFMRRVRLERPAQVDGYTRDWQPIRLGIQHHQWTPPRRGGLAQTSPRPYLKSLA